MLRRVWPSLLLLSAYPVAQQRTKCRAWFFATICEKSCDQILNASSYAAMALSALVTHFTRLRRFLWIALVEVRQIRETSSSSMSPIERVVDIDTRWHLNAERRKTVVVCVFSAR